MTATPTLARATSSPISTNAKCADRVMLGSWQLLRRLGEGAWTTVFQARPAGCAADAPGDYAIKLLKPEHRDNPVAIDLLRREAQVASEISHPHLAAMLSAHVSHAPHFLAMPFLDGATLRTILDNVEMIDGDDDALGPPADSFDRSLQAMFGESDLDAASSIAGRTPVFNSPIPVPHALWVTRQIAEALHALHQGGWLHGDVKPVNIMVSPAGHATLLDLGFARRIADARTAESHDVIAGTPVYCAPEFFCDRICLEPASDIYSLGATLFEMLTGQPPFNETNPADLAAAHLVRQPPDAKQLAPHLLPRLVRLLQRMLAKQPLRRPTTSELIDTLVALEIETLDERLVA